MDSDSASEYDSAQSPNFNSFIQKIEEAQRRDLLLKMNSITREMERLQASILVYQECWCVMLETIQSLRCLLSSIESCLSQIAMEGLAEQNEPWLTSPANAIRGERNVERESPNFL